MKLHEIRTLVDSTPNADEHRAALQKTGFWGKQGAGCLPISRSTGRILMAHRSPYVEQPNTWGTWGGAIDGNEDPLKAALREFEEEAGMSHDMVLETFPLHLFQHESGFRFHTFLVVLKDEFTPKLDWETQGFEWVEFGQWPHELHFGVKDILKNPQSVALIQQQIELAKSA